MWMMGACLYMHAIPILKRDIRFQMEQILTFFGIYFSELIDLAYIGNGGRSVQVSDEHYGPGDFLILPGRGKTQGDGWQTARSRAEGHSDFVVLRLGEKGHILQAEVDTTHFKGNFPREIKLEATCTDAVVPGDNAEWFTLIEPSKTGPNNVFYFNPAHTDKVFTHAKISIIPGKFIISFLYHSYTNFSGYFWE
jgi:allantoicase